MVLTRSNRNQQNTENRVPDTILNMENVTHTIQPTVSASTINNPVHAQTTVTTSTTNITPAVQQFMSMAQNRSGYSNESNTINSSITTPNYSSITARNVLQEFRQNAATASAPTAPAMPNSAADLLTLMREELVRQRIEMKNIIQQEVARAVGQASPFNSHQVPQTTSCMENPSHLPVGTQQNINNNFNRSQINTTYLYKTSSSSPQVCNQVLNNSQWHHKLKSSPAPSLPPEYTFTTPRKIDLSKWEIKFDGTTKSMSSEEFIFRVDMLRQDYNCSFHDIRRSFNLLLEGQALDWFWNFRKLTTIHTWEDLKAPFLTRFRRYESEYQLQKKIMDRRQQHQE